MMDDFDVIVKNIDDKIYQLRDFVATGNVNDLSEYKATCGQIRGLLTAREFVLDQKQKMEKFNG
jgi:hypothetical protein